MIAKAKASPGLVSRSIRSPHTPSVHQKLTRPFPSRVARSCESAECQIPSRSKTSQAATCPVWSSTVYRWPWSGIPDEGVYEHASVRAVPAAVGDGWGGGVRVGDEIASGGEVIDATGDGLLDGVGTTA